MGMAAASTPIDRVRASMRPVVVAGPDDQAAIFPPPFGFLWTTGGRLGHVCVPLLRAVEHYSCSRAARTRLLVQPYVQHWVGSWVVRTTVVTSSFRRTPAVMLCAIARPLGEYGHTPVHRTAIGWQTVSTDGTMGKGSAAI
jgi:hypothetical protein